VTSAIALITRYTFVFLSLQGTGQLLYRVCDHEWQVRVDAHVLTVGENDGDAAEESTWRNLAGTVIDPFLELVPGAAAGGTIAYVLRKIH
jgi:hypothetical protein